MPVPQILERLVNAGALGKKSGRGFYVDYDHSLFSYGTLIRIFKHKSAKADPEITKLLIDKMVNECKACLDEKVVDTAELIDAGMVFGTGFAPFRGGPLRYAAKEDKLTSAEINSDENEKLKT
jgi:3-hydroxyacyl-CoA dehydrogenase/enoyl-CoA hydratase/3-hydroxybutyryl-CoA epimerase